ncbi:uncharacterized protein LOC131871382 [Cryptomeria japonica]|uniref:uncharacterized protein LOC131871382 n=1 Tax=Cryptomeria japonica TaxID=3369 RepID=UPI0027D9F36F|nr:uncharacterized protein LOC131871382 [Cryptomeria japonica]
MEMEEERSLRTNSCWMRERKWWRWRRGDGGGGGLGFRVQQRGRGRLPLQISQGPLMQGEVRLGGRGGANYLASIELFPDAVDQRDKSGDAGTSGGAGGDSGAASDEMIGAGGRIMGINESDTRSVGSVESSSSTGTAGVVNTAGNLDRVAAAKGTIDVMTIADGVAG